ncbi:2-amino-4-hydroxy-6-hydroxymethyldihydropteridine diphosphokinase [Sphingomonas immobilis]|uniref:2-amino-4-hydroxy-6-hydroxymethyldihydropteridine pyrophosphokinase n=1 Tax=Sphingomonas immobilis TaxID=3063997 RepID=A0ABT8ZVY6_9SPHN|nr:2-amino-4-hydroxy-6-hydroxymethyldihydropteridine diphosphokinase [Sphingomonas sp. CA1-15]MDO7841443.1 2-amino-4-hydroxy-6-hydroxymethyldihydropteridine diphosphokinase [Sphingomonas sp. CA1-15]
MPRTSYAIAIGSNRWGRYGPPVTQVQDARIFLSEVGRVTASSPVIASPPLGPSRRRFANAVILFETMLDPPALLRALKAIERDFGRRPGVRWGARVLDLDIVLWSAGPYWDRTLTIPHPQFRKRRFVLDPLLRIAPDWRDPLSGLSVRQLAARARKVGHKVDRARLRS